VRQVRGLIGDPVDIEELRAWNMRLFEQRPCILPFRGQVKVASNITSSGDRDSSASCAAVISMSMGKV